jgi:hypothetical protein
MINMFVNVDNQHPIRNTPATLPHFFTQPEFGLCEGLEFRPKIIDTDALIAHKHPKRSVSRSIVKDKVMIHNRIVMIEKKVWKHPSVVQQRV